MKTLLEEAKALKSQRYARNIIGEQEKEVVIAYLKEEINTTQLGAVIKKNGSQMYSFIVVVIKKLIQEGKINL